MEMCKSIMLSLNLGVQKVQPCKGKRFTLIHLEELPKGGKKEAGEPHHRQGLITVSTEGLTQRCTHHGFKV